MPQVPEEVKKKRAKILQKVADQCRTEFIKNQLGSEVSVLWEGDTELGVFEGLTDNYIRIHKKGENLERSVTTEKLSSTNIS